MERELEFKILGLDFELLRSLVVEKGGVLISHEQQKNTVVDSKEFPLIDDDCYLRIREIKDILNNSENIEFTFKKKIKNEVARENLEYTTNIDNVDNLIEILKNLKFNEYIIGYKERYSYEFKNLRLDFDRWDKETYPYPYLEIEAEKEEDLYEFLKEFNIDKKHVSLKSITDLKDDLKS